MKLMPYFAVLGLLVSVSPLQAADAPQATADSAATVSDSTAETPAAEAEAPAADTAPAASQEAAPEASGTAEAETTEQAGFSRGSVVRSVFTSAIENREPTDKLENTAKTDRLYYFTELRDMSGQTATHRWEYDGKVMAEVKFDVRGPRWRVWSSKSFTPGWAGEWKVSVLNGAGETISEDMISMAEIPAEPAAQSTPAETEGMPAEEQEQPAAEEFQPPVNPDMIQ